MGLEIWIASARPQSSNAVRSQEMGRGAASDKVRRGRGRAWRGEAEWGGCGDSATPMRVRVGKFQRWKMEERYGAVGPISRPDGPCASICD